MSVCLITGGAGFIGSHFVRKFLEGSSAPVIVLDVLTYAGNVKNIEDLIKKKKVIFIQGNICDYKLIESLFSDFEISKIVHFAAESHVDRSISKPQQFIKTNIEGTFNLLDVALKSWKIFTNKLFFACLNR